MKPTINPHARFLQDQTQPMHGPLYSAGWVDEFGHATPCGQELTDPAVERKWAAELGPQGWIPTQYRMADPVSVGLAPGTLCGIPEEYCKENYGEQLVSSEDN